MVARLPDQLGLELLAMADLNLQPEFTPKASEPEERNWVPIIVGLVMVAVVIAGLALIGRERRTATAAVDPYAQYLKAGDVRLSSANNFVGGTVTYVDFTLANTGSQTLVGGQVEAKFFNTLGEVVQKEVLPLRVLVANQLGGYPDLVDMTSAPVLPGKSRTMRLTIEHISADWNQAQPQLRFLNLKVK